MIESTEKPIKTIQKGIDTISIPEKFNYKKNRVVLVKLDDYEPENIKIALKKVIELLDIKDYFKGKSIVLKPNALSPKKFAFTPPEIMVELKKILEQDAKEIIVGDSTLTKSITNISLKRSKIKELCEAEGMQVLNFFESEREKVEIVNPPSAAEESMYLPKEIIEADLLINLPKLKTHGGYVYTGAVKNLFGLLSYKMNMHQIHKKKAMFQKMLADIYFAVEETNKKKLPKVLTIMDAVISMEGNGPNGGKPRKIGLLIAGFNSAAVDIIGYTLMNGNPSDLDVINSVAERTGLPVDISQLEILGEDYSKYVVKDFKKPNPASLKKERISEPGLFGKIRNKATSISIKINGKKCILCEECVRHCPAQALSKKEDKIIIDRDACVECFCCGESCPNEAIDAKMYLFRWIPYLIAGIGGAGSILIWLLISFIFSLI